MKLLMVCLGNICRSPLAEGIMADKIAKHNLDWSVDSAGTSGWHNGETPDKRSVQTAREKGIDISQQRSRLFTKSDFDHFDLILAMDASNLRNIKSLAQTEDQKDKVQMILNYAFPNQNREVPDPYYDGGFTKVYELLDQACESLVESLHLINTE